MPIAGVRVGHWTGAGTGVTVLLAPEGTVGAGEVRGGAPASRELALLEPGPDGDEGRRGGVRRRLGVRVGRGRRRDALPRRARRGIPDRGRTGADRARGLRVRPRRARRCRAGRRRGLRGCPCRRAGRRDRHGSGRRGSRRDRRKVARPGARGCRRCRVRRRARRRCARRGARRGERRRRRDRERRSPGCRLDRTAGHAGVPH